MTQEKWKERTRKWNKIEKKRNTEKKLWFKFEGLKFLGVPNAPAEPNQKKGKKGKKGDKSGDDVTSESRDDESVAEKKSTKGILYFI